MTEALPGRVVWAGMWSSVVLLCGALVAGAAGAGAPVLMWGAGGGGPQGAGPLAPMSADRFAQLLGDQLHQHSFTVVFIEETLSVEDFGLKDSEGNSPYPSLKRKVGSDSFVYIPSVDSPIHTLNKLAKPSNVDRVEMTDEGLSADILPGPGKFLYISLKDAREEEDRFKMLTRHDRFMSEMVDKLSKKHHSVLAIYTAHYPSFELLPEDAIRSRRHLLQAEPETLDNFYNASDRIYFYASAIKLHNAENNNGTLLVNGTASLGNASDSETSLSLLFNENINITFKFISSQGYWNIHSVDVKEGTKDEVTLEGVNLGTPHGFSYHCGQMMKYTIKSKANETDTGTMLTLEKFQVQPFFGPLGQGSFGSAYDCVGVMTVPIWSGIFLVAILLFITSGGVIMMMDIRTMDRFDDPKGKTITISAAE